MSLIHASDYGGKGANLQRLQEAGFRVPAFRILPVSFFDGLAPDTADAAVEIHRRCTALLPEWKKEFAGKKVAVRSSAVGEDGSLHSFAGQFRTVLNVAPEDLPQAVADVWLSGGAVAAYTAARGITATGGMAVILQEMVAATAAGVAFSAHPVNGTEEVVVNAVAGLGDKLVDGQANADLYSIFRGTVVSRMAATDSGFVLTDAQLLELAQEAKRIEKAFNGPQDIEFAFSDDTLYLLQARPITTLSRERVTWDNSNIVESYPGLTLPLTDSFIRKMYAAVYRQFSAILGVPQQKIKVHDAAFDQMLGLLNGRVYYNLNSWFQVLSLLPGYSINAGFMEKMMGVKEKPDISISPSGSSGLKAWAEVAAALRGIVKNLRTARKQAETFVEKFNAVYAPFAGTDFGMQSPAQIWDNYSRFETLMLREWKAPLVNDFFAMIFFGLLQKQCTQLAPEDPTLANRLLAASEAVLTTEPIRELPRIVAAIRSYPALLHLAESGTPEAFYAALQGPDYPEAQQRFEGYLERWGERTVAELKLETITYQQDPLMLIRLLQSLLQSQNATVAAGTKADREEAEAWVQNRLRTRPVKRWLFGYVLKNARYFVSQRENLRYYRTRGFGMVRRMMTALGAHFAQSGYLEEARDVFYLTLLEVESLAKTGQDMQQTVRTRKAQYTAFEAAPLPERVLAWGEPHGIIQVQETAEAVDVSGQNVFRGLPCSPGVVQAVIRKVTYSDALKNLEGGILATYATDPGFVVLFASAGGILTERGSLLSHAAIVSREMGIPCIVGIEGLMSHLPDGTRVEMDGSTGIIRIV